MPKEQTRPSRIYHFEFRWSVEHSEDNKKVIYSWLREKADKFIFQAEYTENKDPVTGEVKGNPHYQGYFHTQDKHRCSQFIGEVNETEMRGMRIAPCSNNGKEELKHYSMKERSRVAGPWADKQIYMGSDLWPESQMPDWQQEMLGILAGDPGDRTMYWIYDPQGNNGKTKFIKYLAFRKDAVGLGYGHSTDVLNLVSKMPDRRIYAWNLTRAKPANLSELDLYSAMESVKDGFFVNLKYETKQVLMQPPHVVVMANHIPNKKHISADRWCIKQIKNGKLGPVDHFYFSKM